MPLPAIESIITVQAGCDGCHSYATHQLAELSDGTMVAICDTCSTATLLSEES